MREHTNKSLIIFFLSFLLLLITSCTPKLEERLKALQEAHNSHDVEKNLSFYADDAKFVMIGHWVEEGKEGLRNIFTSDAALNSRLTFTDIKVNGDTVTCKVKEENDLLKLVGIDAIYYESSHFIFRDGLIIETRAVKTQESIEAKEKVNKEVFLPFKEWIRSQEFSELSLDGEYIINKENVSMWLKLLQEWLEKNDEEDK